MKVGIVGLPNVGKSTLFNALTKSYAADSANFPFCTIEPNIGIVDVKDPRVDKLVEMSNSKNKVYAAMKFVDIAGLVKGASKGEGLGNKFLANIREVDAIVQVVRHFDDSSVVHVEGGVDPFRDIEIINTELILSDLEQIDTKLPQIEKKAKQKDKESEMLFPVLKKIKEALEQGKLAYDISDELNENEQKIIKGFNFLTFKPFIYAFNISENNLCNAENIKKEMADKLKKPVAIVCAKFEAETLDLSEEDKSEFIKDIKSECDNPDIHIPTLDDLIKNAFDEVGLMYFFTTGEKETKAWTVKKNSTAPQCAGAIHTDFERGFIKAEIVEYTKMLESGSWSKAREKGFVKLEGKEYIVKDGDVIIFRFNV